MLSKAKRNENAKLGTESIQKFSREKAIENSNIN